MGEITFRRIFLCKVIYVNIGMFYFCAKLRQVKSRNFHILVQTLTLPETNEQGAVYVNTSTNVYEPRRMLYDFTFVAVSTKRRLKLVLW